MPKSRKIGALPLLTEKVQGRRLKSASHMLAHVVNRMFTTLESKGILRTATEEFALSAKYNPRDALAAECIRTCREETFHGRDFLLLVEAVAQKAELQEAKTILPSAKSFALPLDIPSMYGFRPCTPSLWYLSPWEFTQWFHKERLPPKLSIRYLDSQSNA